jgi:hypothetical protein
VQLPQKLEITKSSQVVVHQRKSNVVAVVVLVFIVVVILVGPAWMQAMVPAQCYLMFCYIGVVNLVTCPGYRHPRSAR